MSRGFSLWSIGRRPPCGSKLPLSGERYTFPERPESTHQQNHHMDQPFLPGLQPLDARAHYDFDPLGRDLGIEGAGHLALIVGDQLHPPMVDDETLWKEGRWYEGAVRHTREAADLCGLMAGERVIDIGCGVCGPARTLVTAFKVDVLGITTSELHARTATVQCAKHGISEARLRAIVHDCQQPYPDGDFDVVWSMNMLYHVPDKESMLACARCALRPGGRLMIDDWMFTPRSDAGDREVMGRHFLSAHLAVREDLVRSLHDNGFCVRALTDLGQVGRTHLRHHFRNVFDRDFRPALLRVFPERGAETAGHFVAAIEATIDLYVRERLTWVRLVGVKR